MTQRNFNVGQVALLKLLNAGFAPHGCWKGILAPVPQKTFSFNTFKMTNQPPTVDINNYLTFVSLTACVPIRNIL